MHDYTSTVNTCIFFRACYTQKALGVRPASDPKRPTHMQLSAPHGDCHSAPSIEEVSDKPTQRTR